MTLVSSEDYSQSKSFMVKGSRNSVKKKKSVKPVLLRTASKRLKTNDILGLR